MHNEAVHFLAEQTNASPAAIWTIIAVAIACLAFWLTAVAIASRDTGPRRRGVMPMTKSVVGGAHLAAGGRSVAPNRYEDVRSTYGVPDQRQGPAEPAQTRPTEPAGVGPAETAQGRAAVPVQPGPAETAQAGPHPRDVMPAQRSGDADQAERSATTGDSGALGV